jgi:thiol-disulfide isomerase/thioredoxin
MVRTALFMVLTALGLINQLTPICAQDAKERSKKDNPAASLKVGDLAPPLKASKWLQGDEVRKFELGKVYVVEFWATWCGWCIITMPDTAELQAQYKRKGVTIIAYSARDPNNSAEKVAAFVKKRGPRLPFTFAYAEDRTTYDAWMKTAGREGLPCVFVVDKMGRIAYIGHPIYLGVVLPMVVAGNKNAKEVGAKMAKIEQEFRAVSASMWPDNKVGLKALNEFEAKYPPLANNPAILRAKLSLLPKVGEVAKAKEVAAIVISKAIKQENPSALRQVAGLLRNGPGKENKELLAVAVKAAEAAVRLTGEKDGPALLDLAETYFAIGHRTRAKEYARKAVEAAATESMELKQYIEKRAKMLENGKKQDKK